MGPYEFLAAFVILPFLWAAMMFCERYVDAHGRRVPAFEAWIRRKNPVVIAFHARAGMGRDVAFEVKAALGIGAEVFNHQGGHPWTTYRFELEVAQAPSSDVVVVRAVACAIRRGRQQRREIGAVIAQIVATCDGDLEEIWLHGELREVDTIAKVDRSRFGWRGAVGDDGAIAFSPMIGTPVWLAAA